MDQVAKTISSVAALHHAEDLAQDGGGCGLERWIKGGESRLDAAVQRFRVLEEERDEGQTVHSFDSV